MPELIIEQRDARRHQRRYAECLMRALAFLLALLPALAVAQPACIPGIYGTTLDVTAPKRSDAGWRIVWLCQTPTGPAASFLACVHGICVETILRNTYIGATQAVDPEATIKAAWAREVKTDCAVAAGASKIVCDEAIADGAALKAAFLARVLPTPPEVWKVAVNSTYTTRPTYAWANGVRATTAATERAAVGAPCDPAVGAGNYRGVLGRADRVALCAKQ